MDQVTTFWMWFAAHSERIRELYAQDDAKSLAALLDDNVRLLGNLAWEIGPVEGDVLFFAISPGGDPSNLMTSRAVAAQAPKLPGWKVYSAKPEKAWDFRIAIFADRGEQMLIDAMQWRYSLVAFDNHSRFDVTLYASELPEMSYKQRLEASHLVLEGALGEEMMLEHIEDVTLFSSQEHPPTANTGSIKHMRNHIETLLAARGSGH